MPAMHIGPAKRRSGYFHEQGTRIKFGDGHPLDFEGLIMSRDNGGATSIHYLNPPLPSNPKSNSLNGLNDWNDLNSSLSSAGYSGSL